MLRARINCSLATICMKRSTAATFRAFSVAAALALAIPAWLHGQAVEAKKAEPKTPVEVKKPDAKQPSAKPAPRVVDSAIAAARTLFLRGKYAEAAEGYAEAAEKDPLAAALGIARCQSARGKLDDAKKTLSNAAAQAKPAAPGLLAELARLAYDQGELKDAADQAAAAIKLDANHIQARWIQAQLARDSGQLKEAEAQFKWFIDYYNQREQADQPLDDPDDLRAVGLAAAEYARWKKDSEQFSFLVNDLRQQQLALDKNYWPAPYEAGHLFLEKFNEAEANKDFKAALAINPNAAEIYAALGQLAVQKFDLDEATLLAERAQALNPTLVEGHLIAVDVLLANFKVTEAAELIEKKVLPLNPAAEATLGRLAACYVVLDGLSPKDADGGTRFGKLMNSVHKRNPAAGTFYFALAKALDSRRRFNEAVRFYEEANRRMPQLTGARSSLGMLYMRLGEEAKGQKLLAESFEADPFNVRTSNMLKVIEVLDTYQTLRTEHFVIRYNDKPDKLLARYAGKYLESQYPELCRQFGFQVPEPSLIEIFSKAKNTNGHGWFSARLIGLPYLGTVGACAGKMVGIASPNEKPYHWGRVLRHEFIHVINLQQSNFNLPHWLAEGIATFNEGYPRPPEWNELLVERAAKGTLFTLENVNFGFIRPQSGLDWQMAYCQSELYVEYMFARFGEDAVAKLLAAFSSNRDTPAAIQHAFNVTPADFQKGFLEFLKPIVASISARSEPPEMKPADLERAIEADPKNPDLLAQLAYSLLSRKDYAGARAQAKKAREVNPKHALAGYVIARTYLVIGENEEALKVLTDSLDRANPHENVLALLAALSEKAEKYAEASEYYELGIKTNRENPRWIKGLARIAVITKNSKLANEMLARLAEIDADNFTVRKKLAQLALEAEDYPGVIRWSREAMFVNVMDPDIHTWLGRALAKTKIWPESVEEFEVAVELDPDSPALRLELAQAHIGTGKPAQARAILTELLKLFPDAVDARKLLEGLPK